MDHLGRLFVLGVIAFAMLGCKPQIGDSCKLSTDCSVTGDRLCDTSQPDGYCTIFNCEFGTCPGESACIEFHPGSNAPSPPSVSTSRFARRFCIATCGQASDCRSGYVCVDPKDRDARMLDNNASYPKVCLP